MSNLLGEPEDNSLGRQLLEAIKRYKATQGAPEEPVVVAPAPPTRDALPPPPFDLGATLAALEHATSEEEAMAAVMAFVHGAETAVKAAPDPVATLTTIFGSECVVTVTAVCAAAVIDLEAEVAATGRPITDRAASRIARSMVDRVTQRAGRTIALAPRVCLVPRVRTQRAPRARRAPRRAVRLSAAASAGDGPPPAGPPPSRLAPAHRRLSFGVIRRPDALPREVDEAQVVPPIRHARVVLDGVVRRVEVPS
jgi:hypothetical protein